MNNSFIAMQNLELEEKPKSNLETFRNQEQELVAIIDACMKLANNPDWQTLKEKIFDGVVISIKKRREIEIEKQPINGPKVHHLNGQLEWAKKYSDILSLANIYKQELDNVRSKINAERNIAANRSLDPTSADYAA